MTIGKTANTPDWRELRGAPCVASGLKPLRPPLQGAPFDAAPCRAFFRVPVFPRALRRLCADGRRRLRKRLCLVVGFEGVEVQLLVVAFQRIQIELLVSGFEGVQVQLLVVGSQVVQVEAVVIAFQTVEV